MSLAAFVILAYVTAGRLLELVIARTNTRRLLEQGGQEVAPGHYPAIVAMHTAWLVGLWFLAGDRPVAWAWVAVFALLQVLRFWTLATIGRRWTTRIIVVPGERLVASGPFRFLRHPNYTVVVGEIAVLPLCFGLWWFALAFSIANAVLLWIRISAEEAALAPARGR
jgi:methyltransferase